MSTQGRSKLREKRNRRTRAEIAEAAIALFLERGFEETSMHDIAEAAGVSRRTAYRHFPNKDDLVFEHPRRWFEVFTAVTEARAPEESVRDLLHRGLMEVARFIQAEPQPVLAAFSVLTQTPSLRARHGKSDALWSSHCGALMFAEVSTQPDGALQAATAAGALMGATNAVIAVWAGAQPTGDIVPMLAAALDQIDSIWPAACR